MKFKLWDNAGRQYIDSRHAAIDSDGYLFEVESQIPLSGEVLYSTGVTDRDGTELYVGDVVEALRTDYRSNRGEVFMIIFNEKLRCFSFARVNRNEVRDPSSKIKPISRESSSVELQVTRSKSVHFRKIGDISTNMTAQILFCGEQ